MVLLHTAVCQSSFWSRFFQKDPWSDPWPNIIHPLNSRLMLDTVQPPSSSLPPNSRNMLFNLLTGEEKGWWQGAFMLLIATPYQSHRDGPDKVPPDPVALSRTSSVSSHEMRAWWSTGWNRSREGQINLIQEEASLFYEETKMELDEKTEFW